MPRMNKTGTYGLSYRLIIWLAILFLNIAGTNAQVSISPGTWITVKEGGSLFIDTDMHIKSDMDSSGYFVDQTIDGDVTITGDITADRYMVNDIWHNISSPVSSETSGCFTGTDLVFWYDESLIWNDWNFGWVWYSGATGGPLMVFRGYDVYIADDPVTISFMSPGSNLNTGPYTYNVTLSDPTPNPMEIPSHMGWNLAGNPYPCPVDWLAAGAWDKSDINDAKYIWDGMNDNYTIFIGGSSPVGLNGGTRYIPSNQGFWVQALQTGSIGINNSARLGDMTGTPDFYKSATADYPLISLVAEGNGKSDEVIVRFISGTHEGFDVNYDATKLYSFVDEVPQLSIQIGKQVFALNTLPQITDDMIIPINFLCGKEGSYSIRLSERSDPGIGNKVYLKDDLEQSFTDLSTEPTYTFYNQPGYRTNRFRLFINPSKETIDNNLTPTLFTVFSAGNSIFIHKNSDQEVTARLSVINMTGQPVVDKRLGNDRDYSFNVNIPSGYYMVQIITNQHVYNKKVLIIN
jgi:hypothetical protein